MEQARRHQDLPDVLAHEIGIVGGRALVAVARREIVRAELPVHLDRVIIREQVRDVLRGGDRI